MPYSQVTYRNGYLFGYLEERVPDTVDLLASEMPDYLVATHYVKEKDMEKKWKKIKDKEVLRGLICEDGDWQTLGREKQSAFFVKHKKELDDNFSCCAN